MAFRFRRLYQAMQHAGQIVQQHWQSMAQRLLSSPRERDAYARGIAGAPMVETATGASTTIRNTAPNASQVDEGSGAYHLPSRINWATARGARRTKDGRYYLIVPFRHYSAQRGSRAAAGSAASRRQMLPRAVYEVARLLRPGQYLTAGESHGQAVHAPGLHPYVPQLPQNVRPGYTHAAIQERLRREPGARRGAGSYMTYRTMLEDSPGWWVPAKPKRPVAASTAREAAPDVARTVAEAVVADITDHIRSQVQQQGRP